VHDVLANDTHGAVLVTAYAQRDGNPLEMREVHTWHLADGKATEFWAFAEDSAELDQFFS
jgi:ketosteroid isomerase-like protein